VPDTIVLVDRTGTVLFINRLLDGSASESVLGAHISTVMPAGFSSLLSSVTERVFAQGEVVSSDLQEGGTDHQMRWYSCHVSPVRLHGRTIAATIRATDITQRRQAEDERRRFQNERESMFERMPIGCILWSRERRIAYANPAAEQIFGFPPDGMNGFGPELINFEEGMPEVSIYFERIEKGDMGLVAEMNNRAADGREVHCEWHPTPLFSAQHELTGIITMVMDISERSSLALHTTSIIC
jgi:PAS domain S-box-containing protein